MASGLPIDVPQVPLAPGYTVSRLIKGGWQLAGGHGVVAPESALRDMAEFVDAGITTFDCADIYTGVESLIGRFLASRPPGSVRVHTKYVPDLGTLGTLTPDDIARTVERSRARLGVRALDLVQFHWWDLTRGDWVGAARSLGALQRSGVTRHLGVTNFGTVPLAQVLDAGVPLVSHQVQYSLLDRRPARGMGEFCARHGIGLLCYGALAGGFMHERWLGAAEPAGDLENRSLVKYRLIIEECGGWARFQALLTLLRDIGREQGVSLGAVAIRWVLDQPGVAAVIVGARNTAHLASTLDALTVEFSPTQRDTLAAFLQHSPIPPGDVYDLERDRAGRHGRIMRYDLNA